MTRPDQLAIALLVSVLSACGGVSTSPGAGGTGAGGSGQSGNTGTGNTGTGNTGTGNTGTGNTGTGGTAACAAHDDDAGAFVRISMLNKTAAPIYIGQEKVSCSVEPLFQVADARGGQLPSLGSCRSPCASLRTQGGAGCAAICAFPSSAALQPGEVLDTSWDGLFLLPTELPWACVSYDTPDNTVACDQARRIEPGTFKFSAQAGTALDCSQTTGADSCAPCMPSGTGGCSTPGSLIGGKILSAEATVLLDASYGIYATPSAGSSPGAGDTAPASALVVQLVFTDQ